ncbi:hypothetical protein L6452_30092 [Arctium lappa]|uniref:Uncharacterized protein n=1 Tax=Arctium lappa TaxID=4217 RepID=A0ACB8ZHY5_ARCLA|nr:hypothetical protein L6452_30092 [Arctium lappa]
MTILIPPREVRFLQASSDSWTNILLSFSSSRLFAPKYFRPTASLFIRLCFFGFGFCSSLLHSIVLLQQIAIAEGTNRSPSLTFVRVQLLMALLRCPYGSTPEHPLPLKARLPLKALLSMVPFPVSNAYVVEALLWYTISLCFTTISFKRFIKQPVEEIMAKHHPDLIMCRKQPGIAIGRLCEKCDGKCVICDSYVRPCTLVRVCDECNYGSFQGRCVICGGVGISDAYYCKECTQQEKDRDGCPKIVNLGSAKTDLFYERKKYGFKKR